MPSTSIAFINFAKEGIHGAKLYPHKLAGPSDQDNKATINEGSARMHLGFLDSATALFVKVPLDSSPSTKDQLLTLDSLSPFIHLKQIWRLRTFSQNLSLQQIH